MVHEFDNIVKLRFAMIDVKKHQGAMTKKKLGNISIHNEI